MAYPFTWLQNNVLLKYKLFTSMSLYNGVFENFQTVKII